MEKITLKVGARSKGEGRRDFAVVYVPPKRVPGRPMNMKKILMTQGNVCRD